MAVVVTFQLLPQTPQASATSQHATFVAKKQPTANHSKSEQSHQVVSTRRRAVNFYRQATWKWQEWLLRSHTPTNYAERRTTSAGYLSWDLQRWRGRWHRVKHYAITHPWERMVARTKYYRACIIDHESRYAGVYKAQNPSSTASGAYQFLDGTWHTRLQQLKEYFHGKLKGRWKRAFKAPPEVQDAVAAYDIMADHGSDWTECYGTRIIA